jgi:hypothetical protein
MSFHPTGITVEIVGTESNTQGRSCEEHDICGSVMAEDVVVRLRKVQVVIDGKEESAIAAYHVSDGIDRCRVGFLQRHLLKHWKQYDGVLAQVIDVYSKDSALQAEESFITTRVVVSQPSFPHYPMIPSIKFHAKNGSAQPDQDDDNSDGNSNVKRSRRFS